MRKGAVVVVASPAAFRTSGQPGCPPGRLVALSTAEVNSPSAVWFSINRRTMLSITCTTNQRHRSLPAGKAPTPCISVGPTICNAQPYGSAPAAGGAAGGPPLATIRI